MGTSKQKSNGLLYSNMLTDTLAVDGCAAARRGMGGCGPAQSPHRCTKCNSPPINGRCTNFILFDVALQLPLDSGLMGVMGYTQHTISCYCKNRILNVNSLSILFCGCLSHCYGTFQFSDGIFFYS